MGDRPSKTISLPAPPNIPPNTVCWHRAVTRKCQDLESLLSLPSPSLSLSVLQMAGTQWSLRNLEDLRCLPQPRLLGSNLRAQPELGKGWVGVIEEGHLITPQNEAWAVQGQGWPCLSSCAPTAVSKTMGWSIWLPHLQLMRVGVSCFPTPTSPPLSSHCLAEKRST